MWFSLKFSAFMKKMTSVLHLYRELSPLADADKYFDRDNYARASFSERRQGGSLDAKQVTVATASIICEDFCLIMIRRTMVMMMTVVMMLMMVVVMMW